MAFVKNEAELLEQVTQNQVLVEVKFFELQACCFWREKNYLVYEILQIVGLLGDAYQRGRHGHAPIKDSSRFLS